MTRIARLRAQLNKLEQSEALRLRLYAADRLRSIEGAAHLDTLEVIFDQALQTIPTRLSFGALKTDRFGTLVEVEDFRLRFIPAGTFEMGSRAPPGPYDCDGPLHQVRLTQGFWLGETPCTQDLWTTIMGDNPSHFEGPKRPVEQVSWDDCQRFLDKLNQRLPGLRAMLPTEAQWEYACRAGRSVLSQETIDAMAWYAAENTSVVAQMQPNDFGLYDMLGNVWEWCSDIWENNYEVPKGGLRIDPQGPSSDEFERVFRGGCYSAEARFVRPEHRDSEPPDESGLNTGFRICAPAELLVL